MTHEEFQLIAARLDDVRQEFGTDMETQALVELRSAVDDTIAGNGERVLDTSTVIRAESGRTLHPLRDRSGAIVGAAYSEADAPQDPEVGL